jgi:hypothetical protein
MDEQYTGEPPGKGLVEAGNEIVGSAAGATLGLIFGAGPEGAIVGAAIAPAIIHTLKWGANEMAMRVLGRREKAKIGAALAFAAERAEHLQRKGYSLRTDGFFDTLPDGRNASRELVEGVVLAARQQFEERKIRHLGYLFANVAYDSNLDAALANHSIGQAEKLSWRQFVLLAALGRKDRMVLPDGDISDDPGEWNAWGVRRELMDLYEDRYIGAPSPRTAKYGLPYPSSSLRDLRLAHGGQLLHHLLSLDTIRDEEVAAIHNGLRLAPSGKTK